MVPLGCKSPKLKHVVCHRRQLYMILKDSADVGLKGTSLGLVPVPGERTLALRLGAPAPEPPVGANGAPALEPPAGGSGFEGVGPLTNSDGALELKEGIGLEELGDGAEASVLSSGLGSGSPEQQGRKETMSKMEVDQTVIGSGRGKEKNSLLDDIMMEGIIEENISGVNTKRKKPSEKQQGGEKARKVQKSLSDEEDEEEPELSLSQEEKLICYPVGKIKKFLSDTKGQRAVRTESFFPDLDGFIKSVCHTLLQPMDSVLFHSPAHTTPSDHTPVLNH
ncbi:hypothetical protein D4764_06G0008770 [Takifugu flavidus]|uniref:Uncharacterized protein n=1 Tax=Takifugu flavidus TaxID=433684 RepID=A0A5C6N133_9TELE|nr:hypothetical protein D4764_06G0008770 [Takifugu flavidus]